MKNLTSGNEKRIIVAFHIGRGGRFYNSGHVSFIGEKNFQDLIQMNSNILFYTDRVNGKFAKPHYVDSNGTVMVDGDNFKDQTGTLNFDYDYDTDKACYIDECTEKELEIINSSDIYKSAELLDWMEENKHLY